MRAALLVVNPGSGAGEGRELPVRVREVVPDIRVLELGDGVDLGAEIGAALSEDRAVIAAGGDGTISAVAQHLVEKGLLAVLPTGTLNHFARDLGLRDLDDAVEALGSGRELQIDLGRVGERYFVNNAGLGLYPELIYEREQEEDGIGKWVAAGKAAARMMRRADPLAGTIVADGDARALLAWMVFVGNNRFETTPGRIGQRERMDEGVLDLGLFLAGRRGARRSQVAWRMLRSLPWQTSRRVVHRVAERVEVQIRGRPRLVSFDGEAGEEAERLDATIHPRSLRVLAAPQEG
jgi:undecaprenyl-diphosphatase